MWNSTPQGSALEGPKNGRTCVSEQENRSLEIVVLSGTSSV